MCRYEVLSGSDSHWLASPPPPAESSAGAGVQHILEAILTASQLDNMTYEELLERFGPGVEGPAAAPKHLIRDMPTRTLTEEDASGSGSGGVGGGHGDGRRVVERVCLPRAWKEHSKCIRVAKTPRGNRRPRELKSWAPNRPVTVDKRVDL